MLFCKENKQNTTAKNEEPTENGDVDTSCKDESSKVKENEDKEKTTEQQNGGMRFLSYLVSVSVKVLRRSPVSCGPVGGYRVRTKLECP